MTVWKPVLWGAAAARLTWVRCPRRAKPLNVVQNVQDLKIDESAGGSTAFSTGGIGTKINAARLATGAHTRTRLRTHMRTCARACSSTP